MAQHKLSYDVRASVAPLITKKLHTATRSPFITKRFMLFVCRCAVAYPQHKIYPKYSCTRYPYIDFCVCCSSIAFPYHTRATQITFPYGSSHIIYLIARIFPLSVLVRSLSLFFTEHFSSLFLSRRKMRKIFFLRLRPIFAFESA